MTAVLYCRIHTQTPKQNVFLKDTHTHTSDRHNTTAYLDIDQQLPQVPWWHDQGGVELNHVTLVQGNVMVRSQTLELEMTATFVSSIQRY
jgi:virulence-associated protein VapD